MSAFSMRKDIQHPHRHAHIYKETDHIVGDLDERSCGESRVDFQFSSVRGTRVPKTVAKITTQNRDAETAKQSA